MSTPQTPANEKTEVIYGSKKVVSKGQQFMSNVRTRMDLCYDHKGPSIVIEVSEYRLGYQDIRSRGGIVRVITEITKDNLSYCKELLKYVDELRHLTGIAGGIAVSDSEFMATTTLYEAYPLIEVIYSNVKGLVELQHFIFEVLWKKAIPAEDRIREIEEGIKPDVIEVFRDATEIQKLYLDLIGSAKNEVLLIFPTANAFIRQAKIGVLRALKEAAGRNVQIKIITPTPTDEVIEKTITDFSDQITTGQMIEVTSGAKSTILVVDKKQSLVMEVREDSETYFSDAIGLATYSNSKATVLSYVSMFESFLAQSEAYKKLQEVKEGLRNSINSAAES